MWKLWALLWAACALKALWQKWTNTPDPPPPRTTIYSSFSHFECAFAASIEWSFAYAGFDEEGRIVSHSERGYAFYLGAEALCRGKCIGLEVVKAWVSSSEYRWELVFLEKRVECVWIA